VSTNDVIDVLVGLAVFALVATLIQTLPRRAIVRSRWTAPVALAAAAVAAAVTTIPLTGSRLWDAGLVAVVVFLAGIAGSTADRRLLVAIALIPAIAPGTATSHVVGALAVGVSFAVAAVGMRLPPVKTVAGGLAGLGLLAEVSRGPRGAAATLVGLVLLLGLTVPRVSRHARRQILWFAAIPVLLILAAGASYARVALDARHHLDQGVQDARNALDAAVGPNPAQAESGFQAAGAEFALATARLASGWARPASFVPVAAQNARALSTAARVGRDLAAAGADAVTARTSAHLHVAGSAVNVAAIQSLQAPTAQAITSLRVGRTRLQAVRSPLLLPIVSHNLQTLLDRIDRADHQATSLEQALTVLPGLLGAGGPRRYFLAIQNPAESRALGGIIGNYALVTVQDGHIELTAQGRDDQLNTAGTPRARHLSGPVDYLARYGQFEPAQTWQNVTLSPDFPSVGHVIEQLFPQSGGVPVDGVISVDPAALAGVLGLIGPVTVPLWPVPLTVANVTPILLHDQYLLPQAQRLRFMSDVVQAVFDRLKGVNLNNPAALSQVFGPLFRQKHVMLYSAAFPEEVEFVHLGAAGAMPASRADSLATVTQNSSGNKIDWYLRRSVRDDVRYDPATGSTQATLTVTLRNNAPSSGVPDYVIGGAGLEPTRPGENRTWVSIYSPLDAQSATFNGQPVALDRKRELGRNVASAFVTLEPSSTSTFVVKLSGRLAPGGHYQLALRAQPTVAPDDVTVRVTIPPGWLARNAVGGTVVGSTVTWAAPVATDLVLELAAVRG